MKSGITVHTIVKNEDRWIWYSLMSVIDFVDKILVCDTGSQDKTVEIIKTINSPKVVLTKKNVSDRLSLVRLRQEQVHQTQTPWFILLDGDEMWPKKNLQKLLRAKEKASEKTLAFFHHSRNCVGDIYHYVPESKGHYRIKDKTGHLNIRLIRKVPGLKVVGEYPLETYTLKGKPIQKLGPRLQYINTWYLHTTHLPRSTSPDGVVIDRRRKRKFRLGIKMKKKELPEILFKNRPSFVPPPPTKPWHYFFPPK